MQPVFSVIIPVYNRADCLPATLESIERQTFRDFEILVVDDGSSDESVTIARACPSVQVFCQQNSGPGMARNRGLSEANGEYVAFLDSDDLWFPSTLQRYAEAIEKFDRPMFVTGKPVCFREENELHTVADMPPVYRHFADYFSTGEEWLWHGVSSFVIRRDVLLSVGGFAEGKVNGEDAELAMKLGTAKGFVHISEPPLFGYRVHPGNITNHVQKSAAGLQLLLNGEKQHRFPGGTQRARERQTIISRHVRPFALSRAKAGDISCALKFYGSVFVESVRSKRWKFLLGLPLLAIVGWLYSLVSQTRPNS